MSTTNGRIYMNDDMLESYANYNEAANSFLDGIALENIMLDTDIQMEFDLGDHDVFSDHAMEAIGETVKNMASKAKSNFVTYAKKLINFLFGWLIRFFQGAANVKKTMAKAYDKAKVYLKKLNELETKARSANKEDKIEIRDYGNCVLMGLTMIQLIMFASYNMGNNLKNVMSENSKSSNNGTNQRATLMINSLCTSLTEMFSVVAIIDIKKPQDLLSKVRSKNYNFAEVYKEYSDQTADMDKVKREAEDEAIRNNDEKGSSYDFFGNVKNQTQQDRRNSKTKTGTVNSLEKQYLSRLTEAGEYMSDPNTAELSLSDAFDELRTKLKLFMDIAKNNKWDLEKNIQGAEKIRRGLEKEINGIDLTQTDEKQVSELLKQVVSVGNNLGQMSKGAGQVMSKLSSCIDGMTTDVAKLGSRVIKIGDKA